MDDEYVMANIDARASGSATSVASVAVMPKTPGPAPMPIPLAWQPLLAGYLAELTAMDRPRTTIATRRGHIARMARELRRDPAELTSSHLRDWFASQVQWRRETRRGYRNSAVSFLRWAYDKGHLSVDLARELPSVRPDRPVPRPAPDRIWNLARMAADPRVMLMLRLAAEAGLRRAEVAQVHVRDLREGFDGPQLLVHGKGSRERVIPITPDLADRLAEGAAGHTAGAGDGGWLFPGSDGGHLSPRWVGKLCATVMPDVWTMHALRHRFATRAYRGTRNLRAVQTLLGHSSVAITERYTAVDDSETRAAMFAAAGEVPQLPVA